MQALQFNMSDELREVIVYLRQYADEDTDIQLEKIKDYAGKNNLRIIEIRKEDSDEQLVLNQIISDISEQKIKNLLLWDLFSLSASPAHLDSIFALLSKNSSHLIIAKDQLDTIVGKELVFSVGRMMLRYAIGSQRLMIRAGQQRAKKEGKQLGRPGISDKDLLEAKDLRAKGLSYRQVGRLLRLDESTVRKNLKRYKNQETITKK
jgi:DNA invertase Pin-like site-specific DNA recombinase